jgi:hypothetical protein
VAIQATATKFQERDEAILVREDETGGAGMKINYGLWWYEGEQRYNRTFSIDHNMDWDSKEDHEELRQLILDKHPGAHIVGYAIDNDEEK